MKILVTGASGFVGRHLCERLLNEGHHVFALVRTPSKMELNHTNLILIKGDLNHSQLQWTEFLPADLNQCIHSAGLVHTYNTKDFYDVNAEGTRYLVEALKNRYPTSFKFILISSLAAGGPVNFEEKRDELQNDFPVSEYGRSKKRAEEILENLAPKSWIVSIVRPPMIIGPGDVAVLDIFKMVKSRAIVLPGVNSLEKEYSFVCVFDLVETIFLLTKLDQSMTLYSANTTIITFDELIEEIKLVMKIKYVAYLPIPLIIVKLLSHLLFILYKIKTHSLRLTPDKIHELAANAWVCDNQKSVFGLKQVYKYSLGHTVFITYQDYLKRKWI